MVENPTLDTTIFPNKHMWFRSYILNQGVIGIVDAIADSAFISRRIHGAFYHVSLDL